MTNFNDVLNKKLDDIEKPPLIPIGTYKAAVKKVPALDTIGKQSEYDVCDFQLQLIEPAADDVDLDELKKFGGCGPHATIRRRFMFNKNDQSAFDRTMYDLKRFLQDHLKVDATDLKEGLNNSVNQACLVTVKWRPDKENPETMYAEVARTAPIE